MADIIKTTLGLVSTFPVYPIVWHRHALSRYSWSEQEGGLVRTLPVIRFRSIPGESHLLLLLRRPHLCCDLLLHCLPNQTLTYIAVDRVFGVTVLLNASTLIVSCSKYANLAGH